MAKVFKVDGSCGVDEPPRVVTVRLESQLAWGKNWNLLSRTRVYPNQFANPCLMTLGDFCQMTYHPACLFVRPLCCDNRYIVRLCACCRALMTNENPARSGMSFSGNRL
ncbi:MAG: hypothetical protein LJE91_08000, partial [Gammaproteobacteria bacterium]|nr:hypothetical protein [Gammaproteobacteria bacterium]